MQNEKVEAPVTLEKTSTDTPVETTEQVVVEETTPVKGNKKTKLRAFPLWLRVLVFIVVLVVVILAGLLIGYSLLGGGAAADVFKMGTWEHIFDIMNGKE